ncbi:MAG: CinA family nicotinamide mononucleotide deamidase-related protein [Planctomycetes bacterium]|nr:CinA family nicotinamide mononucleotide deamidase-related protein [Planctomycetota bacterium]
MPPPTAIICLTGSELTRGETRDTNGPFLAEELGELGFRIIEIRVLPDDRESLERCFRESLRRADLVILSGGLGPTIDDLTVEALARAVGRGVHRDPEAMARMRERALARVGREDLIPANFYKQAEVVDGSTVLLNPVGLAPGCIVETGAGIAITLPGVPRELEAMFLERAVPEIRRLVSLRAPRRLAVKIMGRGESWVEDRIQRLGLDFARFEYGIRARPGEVRVRFQARHAEEEPYLDEVRARLEGEFGDDMIVAAEGAARLPADAADAEHASIVVGLLREAGLTLTTAESCTGGLIAKLLTDVPGSSEVFLGSVVAYDNRVKESLLGVDPALLVRHGAVSREVCRAMAAGARSRIGGDFALATTGIAGPGGGTAAKPVGLVYVALAKEATASAPSPPPPTQVASSGLTQVDSGPKLSPNFPSQVDAAAPTQVDSAARSQVDSGPKLPPNLPSQVDSAGRSQVDSGPKLPPNLPSQVDSAGLTQVDGGSPSQVDSGPQLPPNLPSQVDSATRSAGPSQVDSATRSQVEAGPEAGPKPPPNLPSQVDAGAVRLERSELPGSASPSAASQVAVLELRLSGMRHSVRRQAALAALEMLRKELLQRQRAAGGGADAGGP